MDKRVVEKMIQRSDVCKLRVSRRQVRTIIFVAYCKIWSGVEWSGLEWICKTWSGFVKHGFVKGGFVKGGFVKGEFVKGGFVKHGFVKGGFVKHNNLKLKRATRKVRIFFLAPIKSKTVQGTISGKHVTVLKENRTLSYNIIIRSCASG